MAIANGNVGASFGLVCVAGGSSSIGASVVFFPSLVKHTSRRVLASSLGFSAGVMVYVSFAEIFFKSIDGFVDVGKGEKRAYAYATLSFFGGASVMVIIEFIVGRLTRDHSPVIHRDQDEDIDIEITWNNNEEHCEMNAEIQETMVPHYCIGCSDDPGGELEGWHELAELELQGGQQVPTEISLCRRESSTLPLHDEDSGVNQNYQIESQEGNTKELSDKTNVIVGHEKQEGGRNESSPREKPIVVQVENVPRPPEGDGHFRAPTITRIHPKEEKRKLVKIAYGTALAIFLHNIPEGIATFMAALENPRMGAVLAIAIGIHNIPEGMIVALPIYYATGNRWKAFRWGCLAGISELIAAILGWVVLANAMTDDVYAVIFGIVSGVMLMISLKELIPSAHRYDPEDTVVTCSLLAGMGVMASSLILFKVKA